MWLTIPALHIPDGFLSIPVSAVGWLLLIVLTGCALKQLGSRVDERQIPLLGIMAAFVFAAQMLNFPVAGGTSGHLLGAALVAIILGPWAMIVVMTCVIGVQALLFQDGGLLALGFNVINMGVLSGLVGYTIYSWISGLRPASSVMRLVAAGIGAWSGVIAAAAATALQLAISGTSPLSITLPAMVGVHVLIGIGEALITVAALTFIHQTRPDLLNPAVPAPRHGSRPIAAGFLIALALTFASPLADPNPDGLERVAEDQGFIETAQEPAYQLLPDYTVPFVESEILTVILAGVIGVIVVSGVTWAAARAAENRRTSAPPEHPAAG